MSCSHRSTTIAKFDDRIAFMCDGCEEMGYGTRYNCANGCDYTLHIECETAAPREYHPLYEQRLFFLQLQKPDTPKPCHACGMTVKGWRYHHSDEDRSIFLHPACMKGSRSITIGGNELSLTKKLESIVCSSCKRTSLGERLHGWAYVSADQKLALHVKCMKDKLHEKWTIYSKQQRSQAPQQPAYNGGQQPRSVVPQPSQQPGQQQPRRAVSLPGPNVVPQQYISVVQQPDNSNVVHHSTVVHQPDINGIQHHHHYYHVYPQNYSQTVAPPEQPCYNYPGQQQNYGTTMATNTPTGPGRGLSLGHIVKGAELLSNLSDGLNVVSSFSNVLGGNMLGGDMGGGDMSGGDMGGSGDY